MIEQANHGLRTLGIRVSIKQKKNSSRLYLRATLPPKPNSGKTKPTPTDIALGVSANREGLKTAIAEAKRLGMLLDSKQFNWQDYQGKSDMGNLSEVLEQFEAHYFRNRQRNTTTERTYRTEYASVFKHLSEVSEHSMLALIESKPPATRPRKRYGDSLGKLANFVGLDGTKLREMGRGYNRTQLNPRTIPVDTLITRVGESLPEDLHWGFWAIAAYGLRPHELYLLDFTEAPMVYVGRGKSNERVVFPFPPEWMPGEGEPLPTICKGNSARGERVTHAYSKHLPFRLYDLRHAWAIRTIEYGLDLSLAAQQMGHSVKVHSDIYHHWITKDTHLRAWQKLTN